MNSKEIIGGYVGQDPVQALYLGSELIWSSTPPGPVPYDQQYFTVEMLSAGTFTISINSSWTSVNGGPWESGHTRSLNLDAGDKVRIKHTGTLTLRDLSGNTTPFMVYGNILSLNYGDDFASVTAASASYNSLFSGCTGLITAENLILPAVNSGRYESMFSNCSSLITPPALPATTLGGYDYSSMFYNCSSMVKAPVLPATTLASYCYQSMFKGCSKNWVSGVSQSGTFVMASGMESTWVSESVNGIPIGWSNITAPANMTGVWMRVYVPEDGSTYEVSGTPSGNTYVWDDQVFDGGTSEHDFVLFDNGDLALPNQISVCGYAYDYCDPESGGVCGGEGGDDPVEECRTLSGATESWVVANYGIKSAVYTPGENSSLAVNTLGCCEDPGVDCSDWENLGYESYEDCTCQNFGEGCEDPGYDCENCDGDPECECYCSGGEWDGENCNYPEGTDCSDWENMGYSSYEECDCAENGNCEEGE